MPIIQGPITFKQGKKLPDKFIDSMKESGVAHPFNLKETKVKKKKRKSKKK